MIVAGYEGQDVYYGDLHSHCAVGYGHGSAEDAYENARLQLDFACVTPHARWPDIPRADERLQDVVAYHERGFERTADLWSHFQEVTEAANQEGQFVTFLGMEWHCLAQGDHNIYYKGGRGERLQAANLAGLRAQLRRLQAQGQECFVIPHHIGYLTGYRGINWADFTPEFSPVVEMMSMHGCAESDEAPYPYLHTMGPRDRRSTAQYGWSQGHVCGVIGSTDHHSAHPGSYGHGRLAVWAEGLSRDAIWRAIAERRTYALTGDRISLAFALNGRPMGSQLPGTPEREIEIAVAGGAAIDRVELLCNNRVIERWLPAAAAQAPLASPLLVHLELGWSLPWQQTDWDVELAVAGGTLLAVEPRFRGPEVVDPNTDTKESHVFSHWQRPGEGQVAWRTRTRGNPTTTTAATQGVCLRVAGDAATRLQGRINGQAVAVTLGELAQGPQAGYLGGFLSPAYCFQRAVGPAEHSLRATFTHKSPARTRDWYYVRVGQKNGQWAWGSPIWVG
jgi:hypothetical protein